MFKNKKNNLILKNRIDKLMFQYNKDFQVFIEKVRIQKEKGKKDDYNVFFYNFSNLSFSELRILQNKGLINITVEKVKIKEDVAKNRVSVSDPTPKGLSYFIDRKDERSEKIYDKFINVLLSMSVSLITSLVVYIFLK